jgi:hypothetical protein
MAAVANTTNRHLSGQYSEYRISSGQRLRGPKRPWSGEVHSEYRRAFQGMGQRVRRLRGEERPHTVGVGITDHRRVEDRH